jgi:hypothetical protein
MTSKTNARSPSRRTLLAAAGRAAAVLLLPCLAALAVALPTGCVNVKVDADGLVREYSRALDRVTAEKIARDNARQEGIHVEVYKLDSQQREGAWWVFFEATPSAGRGDPAHFTVRVANDGKAEIMRPK